MDKASEKIRFAVVGCGHIGKRHAEMILGNPESELVALCDIKPKEQLGIDPFGVPFFKSIEELLDSGLPFDVVNVCTPNGLHARHSLQALEKRFHVVCEKPMALTKAQCEAVIYKSLQVSRQLFLVMQNRYSPPSVWIKEMVENKTLGEIYMVQVNCYWNRDSRYYKKDDWKGTADLDGGTLFTQFAHFVDIMYWLFGDIKEIQAFFNDFAHADLTDFEDSGMVGFNFVNGGMGCINYSTAVWDKNMESSITIVGSKGSVKIGGQYMNEVEYCHVENYEMPQLPPSAPPNDYGPYKGSAANHHFIIQNVVDTLKGRTTITTNALEGLKVVEIIERIYALRDKQVLNNKKDS
ncbi:MAG: Gfo/Idh/MocA family oxidoreductase [Bacteroidales bacterium]|nr:Gfo/Idh/MocA family oxidoreductase [Bacteroidales bacterium]NLM93434.1 Gfo/Idh/MocA family oxidoreductase [Bacteroidales bacterium]